MLLSFTSAGILFGSMICRQFPDDALRAACSGILAGSTALWSRILTSILPLAAAACLAFSDPDGMAACLIPGAYAGMLSFSLCALLQVLGPVGLVPGSLLLMGSFCSLGCLLWFLVKKEPTFTAFLLALGLMILFAVFCGRLSDPLVCRLSQSVFIFS